MTSGVPWQVAGVHPEARETAHEAARRAGISVGDWLDLAILQSARTEAAMSSERGRDDARWGPEPRHDGSFDTQPQRMNSDDAERPSPAPDAAFSAIKARLGELARELEELDQFDQPDQLGNANAGQKAAKPHHNDRTPRQIASSLSRLGPKLDPLNANSRSFNPDANRRAVDRASPDHEARRPAPSSPLAEALAEIAERQRMLDGESALLQVGLPRAPTQGLGGLEQQLRGINTQREMLQPDTLDIAIDSLRDGLAEISLMIKEATPRQAIEALETEVRSLAQRTNDGGPHDLAGLERGLAEVRDALRALTPAEKLVGVDETVRVLSRKIDGLAATRQDTAALEQIECAIAGLRDILSHVASKEALAKLADEVRIVAAKLDHVARSDVLAVLEQRITTIAAAQSRPSTGQTAQDLEALMLGLADKFERLQLTGNDHAALKHVEDRIAALIEKRDNSDARYDHVEAIERAVADLRILLVSQRVPQQGGDAPARLPDVDTLKHDVKRTQDSIEALHSTLGIVVKRLATIETGIRGAHATTPPDVQTLPPDYPLEPGLGLPRGLGNNTPADRIAASEAALGPVRPTVTRDPDGKSDFIAAARRAAQAASSQPVTRSHTLPPEARRGDLPDARPARRSDRRIRTLLVGAIIALIVLGSVLTKLFSGPDDPAIALSEQPTHAITANAALGAAPPVNVEATREAPGFTGRLSELFPASIPLMTTGVTPPATIPNRTTTSSVEPPSRGPAALPHPPARPTDKLPATIGGSALRIAAAQGDPGAEFEVAVRFAEGRGVPQDLAAAVEWFERAARQGLAPAQFRLGGLYEKGTAVKKDLDRARRLYLAAAQSGNAKAMHNLAVLYAEGIDGKPDYATAASWFRRAADHGMTDSQFNLGVLYARGIGVETNLTEAYKWFALAARNGDRESVKKRDEVGARLDPAMMAAVRTAMEAWIAEPQPEAATQVKAPVSGWDSAQAAAKRDGGPESKASRTTQ